MAEIPIHSRSWSNRDLKLWTVAASLLVSLYTLLLPEAPNDDAYIYVRTAEIFLNEGLGAAFEHYTWASYSILIAIVSLTGLDPLLSAYLINALFYCLLVWTFVSLVQEIDSSQLTMVMAAITVLVYPQLNEYRYFVIRDIGFWALALFGLWLLLRYRTAPTLKMALGYCATWLLAVSLRPEAVVYMLLLPLSLLFDREREKAARRQQYLLLTGVVLVIAVIALIGLALAGVNAPDLFIDFISVYAPFLESTFNPSPADTATMASALFGEHAAGYSAEYMPLFMVAGLFAILLANLWNGIGGPYLIVLAVGLWQKSIRIVPQAARPLLAMALVNALILVVFIFITRYLTSRYAMLFCLMLALLIPGILARLWDDGSRGMRNALVIFLVYCAFDSYVSFGVSKDYVYDVVDWLETETDPAAALITNNSAVAYYSGRVEDYDQLLIQLTEYEIFTASPGDLIAIEMSYAMEQLVAAPDIDPLLQALASFPAAEDPELIVFRRVQP